MMGFEKLLRFGVRITAEERVAPERLVVFRGEDLIVSEAHEAFWIADILAYEAKGTSRTVSQLPDMVVREGGLPAATFLATSQHGGFLLDTCAPNNFALVVENRSSDLAKFSAVVVGKAITK